jgi:acetamidase/formamidase
VHDFLTTSRGLTRHAAYQLVSIAGNVAITQLVDKPNLGVQVNLPKSIFTKSKTEPTLPR